jgi:hypothetical protein
VTYTYGEYIVSASAADAEEFWSSVTMQQVVSSDEFYNYLKAYLFEIGVDLSESVLED